MGERTAEEWGRIAVSLPRWRWMPGMRAMHIEDGEADSVRGTYLYSGMQDGDLCIQWDDHAPRGLECSWANPQNFRPHPWVFDYAVPDPDDPATAGCLLALAGAPHRFLPTVEAWISGAPVEGITSLGRAVIADVRDQWGRWPGGEG